VLGEDNKGKRSAMLDALGVLISTVAVLYVAWRAAKLDELYPWFEHVPEGGAEAGNDAKRNADALAGRRQSR
jgi:hypothetical protein